MNEKLKILHIVPHLGGGLGTVLRSWIRNDKYNYHILACLEKTNNATEPFDDLKYNIYEDMYNHTSDLRQLIIDSDIVIINWYNHPKLFDLMVNFDWPKCRMIGYNHVNSLYAPYNMSEKLINFFDKFIFTTMASYEAYEINNLPEYLKPKLGCIESAFGSEGQQYVDFKKIRHEGFNVGFTGTASYSKTHPSFIKMCSRVKIYNVKFIVCSGDSQDHMKQEVKELGIEKRFSFEGRVESVLPYLAKFDVFGYPLQPKHLGSAEQAIGEAMICGVVPVVMNNRAEHYIIDHLKNGIIANTEEEYSEAIEFLYRNPELREKMSVEAIKFAKERYSITRKIDKWNKIFDEVMSIEKQKHKWESFIKIEHQGTNVFIQSLGKYGHLFYYYVLYKEADNEVLKNEYIHKIKELYKFNWLQFTSESKGGPKQYLKAFPNDPYLKEFVDML